MTAHPEALLWDPGLARVAIEEAAQLEMAEELSKIAERLYAQLGEARSETARLRAAVRVLASAGPARATTQS